MLVEMFSKIFFRNHIYWDIFENLTFRKFPTIRYTFHTYTFTCVLSREVYFHAFTSTRRVFPRVYFHETCTLHDTSKCGPRKHVTGMQCSIVVVPRKITCGKRKLQLNGTVCIANITFVCTQTYVQMQSQLCYNTCCIK